MKKKEKSGRGKAGEPTTGGYEGRGTLSEHERERTGGERSEQDGRATLGRALHYPLNGVNYLIKVNG